MLVFSLKHLKTKIALFSNWNQYFSFNTLNYNVILLPGLLIYIPTCLYYSAVAIEVRYLYHIPHLSQHLEDSPFLFHR